MLLVPAGRTDVLASEPQAASVSIRVDLFAAFTQFRTGQVPYYDRDQDRVIWVAEADKREAPNLVPIPPATVESETQLRQEFIENVPAPLSDQLSSVLKGVSPLFLFGREIRNNGLQRKWHIFRTERVMEKIQRWATDSKIAWKDAWLTSNRILPPTFRKAVSATESDVEALSALLTRLDASELQRISIPLDLVLKALKPRREP
jgi:hypothetical protein